MSLITVGSLLSLPRIYILFKIYYKELCCQDIHEVVSPFLCSDFFPHLMSLKKKMFIALVRLIDCYKEIKISPQENIALVSLGTKALWNILYFDYLVLIPKPSEQSGGLIIK